MQLSQSATCDERKCRVIAFAVIFFLFFIRFVAGLGLARVSCPHFLATEFSARLCSFKDFYYLPNSNSGVSVVFPTGYHFHTGWLTYLNGENEYTIKYGGGGIHPLTGNIFIERLELVFSYLCYSSPFLSVFNPITIYSRTRTSRIQLLDQLRKWPSKRLSMNWAWNLPPSLKRLSDLYRSDIRVQYTVISLQPADFGWFRSLDFIRSVKISSQLMIISLTKVLKVFPFNEPSWAKRCAFSAILSEKWCIWNLWDTFVRLLYARSKDRPFYQSEDIASEQRINIPLGVCAPKVEHSILNPMIPAVFDVCSIVFSCMHNKMIFWNIVASI